MGRAEDRRAAKQSRKAGGSNKKLPGTITVKCNYPPCKVHVNIPDPTVTPKEEQLVPFCDLHRELVAFCLWLVPKIQIKRQETKDGIILPGHRDYRADLKQP